MKRYRVYCGPTVVERAAEQLKDAGVQVDAVGTSHVYFSTEKTIAEMLLTIGIRGFSWRDIVSLGDSTAATS